MQKLGDLVRRYADLRDEIARENVDDMVVEYISTEKAIEKLESEIKYITESLSRPYRNMAQERADAFIRVMRERDVRESKEQIEQINETIADLENRLQQAESDMLDFDSIEASIKEEAQKLDVDSVEAITPQEVADNSKAIAKVREDSEFLNKMREEQQKIIEDLRKQMISANKEKSYYEMDLEKAQEVINQIDQKQENGYEDLEAKKVDENKLAEKMTLLEQNRAKLTDLKRDKTEEAKAVLEQINDYQQQTAPEPPKTTPSQEGLNNRGRRIKSILSYEPGSVRQFASLVFSKVKNFLVNLGKNFYEQYDVAHWNPFAANDEQSQRNMPEPYAEPIAEGPVR